MAVVLLILGKIAGARVLLGRMAGARVLLGRVAGARVLLGRFGQSLVLRSGLEPGTVERVGAGSDWSVESRAEPEMSLRKSHGAT